MARVFARVTFLADNRSDLSAVSVPTLVAQCAHDAIAPREVGAFVHEQIPGSELVTLNATGHCTAAQRTRRDSSRDRGVRAPIGVTATTDRTLDPRIRHGDALYDNAPCGFLTTLPDGRITEVNRTLTDWLGFPSDELVGKRYFSDLLSVGGRIYHETHYAPLLLMHGQINGIALELVRADRTRLPVLAASVVEPDAEGRPALIRTMLFDARERRAYETELLRARREAELERERLRTINATLQATLLPPSLPAVPGLEVDAYYHIASPDEVGGDFYDLFPARAGTWGLFLGDVCGKGARAAAVTSIVRYTLRAAAVYETFPSAALRTLNTTLLDERDSETRAPFCTLTFGTVAPDPDTGRVDIRLASGGIRRRSSCARTATSTISPRSADS